VKNFFSWRRALAVPAALTLALSGALLTSTAAQAAPAALVVTSPVAGSTVDSRTVTVSGTVLAGAIVDIYKGVDASGTRETRINTGNATTFSTTLTYAIDAPVAQSIYVTGIYGGSGFSDPKRVDFTLPAAAPVKFITIDSPAAGPVASRSFTVTGTATPNSIVIVRGADRELGRQSLDASGAYSIPVVFTDADAINQTLSVNGLLGGSGIDPVTRDIVLPAVAAPAKTVTLDSPVAGSTAASRLVTFTGTAPVGSTVVVTGPAGELGRQNLGSGSTYSISVTYSETAPVAQTVTVSGFVGASGFDNTVERSFNLPAAAVTPEAVAPATPVITSPVPAQVVVGQDVTISGTGTPGANIAFLLYPTDEAPASSGPLEDAITDSVIVVAADGTWSSTVRMVKPGEYSVVALSFFADANGEPTVDADGNVLVSDLSNVVEFRVAAATPIVPAGTSATPVRAAGSLAFTGSDDSSLVIGLGAALTLAGAGLVLAARRRRAQLSTVDAQQD
jgi:hypothetical protein